MGVAGLDHVNIRTDDPAATIAFYRDVLGMTADTLPGMDPAQGGWMRDAAGHPIVHVGHADLPYPSDPIHPWRGGAGEGALHHVALSCQDRPAMAARLAAQDVSFTVNAIPQVSLTQLFVTDPNGILLELNFHEP